MGFPQVNIKVSPGTRDRLTETRDQVSKLRQRQVTFNELLTEMADLYDAQAAADGGQR